MSRVLKALSTERATSKVLIPSFRTDIHGLTLPCLTGVTWDHMTSRQCLLGTGQIRNLPREMGLERWQPCSHFKPRGSRRFPLQVGMETGFCSGPARTPGLLRIQKEQARLLWSAQVWRGRGKHSPCPWTQQDPTWSTNYFPLGAEQGQSKFSPPGRTPYNNLAEVAAGAA